MARPLVIAVLALLAVAAPAAAMPHTTAERTIQDCNDDRLLEFAPGEPHTLGGDTRGGGSGEGCAPDRTGERPLRLPETASLLNFLQLSDFQIVDEESPGRVEFLDGSQRAPFLNPFSAAHRPQESLTTQVTESMVRQVRNTTSPVTGARLDMAILTGDNADSQQYNETRWFIDILDGTVGPENPDPEMEDPAADPDDPAPARRDRKIDPNSGIPQPGCEATPGSIYDGVRNSGRPGFDDGYYEPDASGSHPTDPTTVYDGDGYSPNRVDNARDTGREVRVRDFPGLFEDANEPFEALGLGLPWYSAFGNHDALVQGNSQEAYFGPGMTAVAPFTEKYDEVFHAIVTGCVKVEQLTPAQLAVVQAARDATGDRGELAAANAILEQACATTTGAEACRTAVPGPGVEIVPPDPRRCYLAKDDGGTMHAPGPCQTGSWIGQHFRTAGAPVGHGFAPNAAEHCGLYERQDDCRAALTQEERGAGLGRPLTAVVNHDGYYSFRPRPGFRFVVLDTITDECGLSVCAEGSVDHQQFEWMEDQFRLAGDDEYVMVFAHHTLRTTRSPNTDATESPVHYGQRADQENLANPSNPATTRTLEEAFCDAPNLLAYVTGHEHANAVRSHRCQGATSFPEVSTAAHIDYPQQSRMIEIVDIGGEMSLVLTILDHASPPRPAGRQDTAPAGDDVLRLGSIARELAYNDYQGQDAAARGSRSDRNVVLPLHRPPPAAD